MITLEQKTNKVNNWGAAGMLDKFKANHIKRLEDDIKVLEEKLSSNLNWKYGEKEKARYRLEDMKKAHMFYKKLHTSFEVLIRQHEALTNDLVDMYIEWRENVSDDGEQPSEMMEEQAGVLQGIFRKVYGYIEEVLEGEIEKPK